VLRERTVRGDGTALSKIIAAGSVVIGVATLPQSGSGRE
jgi:hypothetical protein